MRIFSVRSLLFSVLLMLALRPAAQKPVIDSNVYEKWPRLELDYKTRLSNDGNYLTYLLQSRVAGGETTVIQALHGSWKVEIAGNADCQFTSDGQQYIFTRNDSIGIGKLGQAAISYLPGARDGQLSEKEKGGDWLIYHKSAAGELMMRDLQTGEERSYGVVQSYWTDKGRRLFLLTGDEHTRLALKCVTPGRQETRTLWEGLKFPGYLLPDDNGGQVTFLGDDPANAGANAIYYYREGMDKAEKVVGEEISSLDGKYDIKAIYAISGNWLCFNVQQRQEVKKPDPRAAQVDIYNYKDAWLQAEQLVRHRYVSSVKAVLNLTDGKVTLLEGPGFRLIEDPEQLVHNAGYVLVSKYDDGGEGAGQDEWNWNPHAQYSIYLLALKDGTLRPICKDLTGIGALGVGAFSQPFLSPDGRYVIYYNTPKGSYFSYSVVTGALREITKGIRTNWTNYDTLSGEDELIMRYYPVGLAGYLPDGHTMLLYDRRDVYQVDLDGQRAPLCLTNYYGRMHNIRFRLTFCDERPYLIPAAPTLLVNAFDHNTKDDGFYRIRPGVQRDPEYMTKQHAILDGIAEYEVGGKVTPVKARDAECYIVQHQTAADAPNLFYTSDFRNFTRITDLQPQRGYNWLTTELITWKTFSGASAQGILFKPENFDASKKYPLILYYYERYSNSLNRFLLPEANGAVIDIPTFVSNGYLVFIPDIHYSPRQGQGPGCYNYVVSAAQYLAQKPWVDSKRMGINGHSRGGFQTDYLITHTSLFAAAISGSGYSDAISLYTRLRRSGNSGTGSYELTHQRIGATLWQRPDLFLANSPVLRADKVTTPVLMMNNKDDGDIPFEQGAQFFVALRRLGKKAWMLQYDGQGHVLMDKTAANDLSIRMQQFFDYYLKGSPPPVWMTRGVPSTLKGIDTGLEMDNSGMMP